MFASREAERERLIQRGDHRSTRPRGERVQRAEGTGRVVRVALRRAALMFESMPLRTPRRAETFHADPARAGDVPDGLASRP